MVTLKLQERIVEIAHVRRRFGYRRTSELLLPEYPAVNHKRVYRNYRQANKAVRKRKKVKFQSTSGCRCSWLARSMRCGAWTSSATA